MKGQAAPERKVALSPGTEGEGWGEGANLFPSLP
jgi:hypothetical protein